MKNIKTIILNIILVISLILTIVTLILGVNYSKSMKESDSDNKTFTPGYDEEEVYHLTEHTQVDFYEPIIEQFNKESQFVVSSVDASIDLNIKQTGLIDVDILNKTQKITYKGTGRFYIDMSELTRDNILVDDENKTVTITIPHVALLPIEIDPNRFESEDAKKGLLAFGDLKFTPMEYNDLQTECKTKIEKRVNTKENRILADENALEEIRKIYSPIIEALDNTYTLSVVQEDILGTIE